MSVPSSDDEGESYRDSTSEEDIDQIRKRSTFEILDPSNAVTPHATPTASRPGLIKIGSAITLVLVAIVSVAAIYNRNSGKSIGWNHSFIPSNGHIKTTWLDEIITEVPSISPTIQYTRRCFLGQRTEAARRESVTDIDEPLLLNTRTIHINRSDTNIEQPSCFPLGIDVRPLEETVDASHFVFGVSTTLPRLLDSIPQLARWLSGTKAKLVVMVVGGSSKINKAAQNRLLGLGVNAVVIPADDGVDEHVRHVLILKRTYENRDPDKTQWHVVIDDDTFFPFMPALVAHMKTKYDYKLPLYIGALSENDNANDMYGDQAFGGAGVLFSDALAAKMHPIFSDCLNREPTAGDVMLRDCVYHYTDVKLTVDDNFHQMDMVGEISGFYESGDAPLSVHHWKSSAWFDPVPITQMHLISDFCGDCFLQRWRFSDNFILSNGFSAVQYPNGIDFDLDKMEETFYQADAQQRWRVLQLRPKVAPEMKLSYRLLTAKRRKDGSIRQIYLRRGDHNSDDEAQRSDQIIDILWTDKLEE